MSAISIRDVVMRFDGVTALDGVSLDVDEGAFVTLLGPSGCGKTTLLNLISGFLQPSEGVIKIAGKDVVGVPPEARDTALCFQSYALFPHLSVEENLAFGLRQRKTPAAERAARLSEVVGQVDLRGHLSKLPNQLSGGQQQRVSLGRALAVRPYVILFDEPLSNLDAKLRETVRHEIRAIQRAYGLTAVYVTHDQNEALAMSDEVFVMHAGSIEQSGTPEALYHSPKTRFVAEFVGSANVMPARILGSEQADLWQIVTPLGPLTVRTKSPPEAQHAYIAWRAETAVMGAAAASDPALGPALTGRVTARSFEGAYTDLFCEHDGTAFRIQQSRTDAHEGEQITFHLRPEDITFLSDPVPTDQQVAP